MTSATPSPLKDKLATHSGTSVIAFGAEWNPASIAVRSFLQNEKAPAGVEMLYVDIDHDEAAPALFNLRCIPTVHVYRDGKLTASKEMPESGGAQLTSWVKAQL